MKRRRSTHYIQPLPKRSSPTLLAAFDTESRYEQTSEGTIHRWRLGAAKALWRRTSTDPWSELGCIRARTPDELWDAVESWTRSNCTLWVYAHNLAFDFSVARGWQSWPQRGWELTGLGINGRGRWLRYRKGNRRLVFSDSSGWLPARLRVIGDVVGRPKLEMPAEDAPEYQWWPYVLQDVEIVLEGICELIEWVERNDLGPWQYTSPSQVRAAWRHRFLSHRVLVRGDPDVQALERAAYNGGRCEVYQLGVAPSGGVAEVDICAAYGWILAQRALPSVHQGAHISPSIEAMRTLPKGYGAIVQGYAFSEVPVLPVRSERGIIYPVGEFFGVWCQPEVELALAYGASFELVRMEVYRLDPICQRMARWILRRLYGPHRSADPLERIVLKSWSRYLAGILGQRTYEWRRLGRADHESWWYAPGSATYDPSVVALLQLGHDVWAQRTVGDARDAPVAAAAWVTSLCRVELWRLMRAAGFRHVLYCDTDSVIVTPAGLENLTPLLAEETPGKPRVKRTARRCTIWGPKRIEWEGGWTMAGIPEDAQITEDLMARYELWPGFALQIRNSALGTYVTELREAALRMSYDRMNVLADGHCVPLRMAWQGGTWQIVPPPSSELEAAALHAFREHLDATPLPSS